MENLTSIERDHLLAKPHFDRGDSRVVTGSGVFHKTKEVARICCEEHDKELVQVGDYWLAKNSSVHQDGISTRLGRGSGGGDSLRSRVKVAGRYSTQAPIICKIKPRTRSPSPLLARLD